MKINYIFYFAIITAFALGCSKKLDSNNTNPENNIFNDCYSEKFVDRAKVEKVKLGMSMEEVQNTLAPASSMGLSVPMLAYRDADGREYFFIFYDYKDGKMVNTGELKQIIISITAPDAHINLVPKIRTPQKTVSKKSKK